MNMSRKAISIFCGLILMTFFTLPAVEAYGEETHKTLTRCVFGCTKMLRIFDKSERLNMEQELLKACVKPDDEEIGFLFEPHFYDPSTVLSKLNKDTALTRMYSHFKNGVALWNRGNKVGSMDELGRALHYMQDLCCVVHSRSWLSNVFDLSTHIRYENDMNRDRNEHLYTIIDSGKLNFDFRGSKDVRYTANFYSNQIKDCYKGASTKATFEEFEIAYKASCELVYLFFKECSRPL